MMERESSGACCCCDMVGLLDEVVLELEDNTRICLCVRDRLE